MQKQLHFRVQWLLAVLVALLAALGLAARAHAAGPALANCTLVGTTRTCELWAKTGTVTVAGNAVAIWGYADSASGAAQLPGPSLVANQGETVVVILHNDLGEASSLALHGQGLRADTAGASAGGTATYTFVAVNPGTFLYEAGLTANSAKQVAMGLYGALIIQPSTPDSTYTNETVLVLSELDPALNANPTAFDMLAYSPKYWLINGEAHPDTDAVLASAGQTMRVRYVNAGLTDHSPALLGLDQTVFAKDGYGRPTFRAVAETVAAGQTMDVLIEVPATVGARYPLYDGNQHMDNNGAGSGGMLTYIEAITPPALTVTIVNTPPTASISAPADGSAFTLGTAITLTGTASDTQDGDVTASLAWASDLDGALGTGGSLSIGSLSEGLHTITAIATDSGSLTGSASITLKISANSAPTATIDAPADAATFALGSEVTFTGTGADAEDGDLSANLAWSSDRDGPLGTGGTVVISTLSAGTHIITASVTDTNSQTGTVSITITITP